MPLPLFTRPVVPSPSAKVASRLAGAVALTLIVAAALLLLLIRPAPATVRDGRIVAVQVERAGVDGEAAAVRQGRVAAQLQHAAFNRSAARITIVAGKQHRAAGRLVEADAAGQIGAGRAAFGVDGAGAADGQRAGRCR